MPRSPRFEYPCGFYRGNRREAIFRDDGDHRFFLRGLGEACEQRTDPRKRTLSRYVD
jgi:hypothetical protein